VDENKVVSEKLIAWPPKNEASSVFIIAALFGALFSMVYIGADALGGLAPIHWDIAFQQEKESPFIPVFSIAYLSIIPLLMLSPFIFRSSREILPLFCAMSLEVLLSGIFFLLIHIEKSFPPREADGISGFFFNIADTINLHYNDFPSLHIALSITACAAFAGKSNRLGKLFFSIWAIAILASVHLIHEHHLLEMVAGLALAIVVFAYIYRPLNTKSGKDRLGIEWICLTECFQFAKRHRRYLFIALILYTRSLLAWNRMRVLRSGFCLLQVVDDLLDGDRMSDVEPETIAANLVWQLENGEFSKDRLGYLAQATWADLGKHANDPKSGRRDLVVLIKHMMLDRKRARDGMLFSEEQLRNHHRATFQYSLNIVLNALGSKVRTDEMTELLDAFGWCSTMRDLREDLEHGLINIPEGIALRNGLDKLQPRKNYEEVLNLKDIQTWMQSELKLAWQNLDVAQDRESQIEDNTARKLLSIFIRSMRQFAIRFEKKYSLVSVGDCSDRNQSNTLKSRSEKA
jgi:hypothetical protein